MPNEIETAAKTMSGRNHSAAPKFDGDPETLTEFLDEIEQLAGEHKLSAKQTIEWTIRYAPSDQRRLWQLKSAKTEDWEQFKNELYELYPESLETMVNKQTSCKIASAKEFGTYQRSFLSIAEYLKSESKLSEREINSLFIKGLEKTFKTEVMAQLKAENPWHRAGDPYSIKEVASAAIYILTSDPSRRVEATIDDGSQILTVRQDLWEKFSVPLRSDKKLVMESANKSKENTMGLIQDLKINMGGLDFYVQVQVVRDGPFELLLGRLFLTLTEAVHQYYASGNSQLTLTDPNTSETITIPTRHHQKK
ncbi:hypothetical protein BYT27DRAFT_7220427 [Phlegmacium glaucopus]|nr:hypothetical protein BYT27DRAFT_7220427 [Phlegmacium glaucopus]